jgi:hypothetical protein
MREFRLLSVLAGLVCLARIAGAADFFGENLIEVKLALPKGDLYMRGSTDPVADLVATLTLTNVSKKENLSNVSITVPANVRLSSDELTKLTDMTDEQRRTLVENKKATKQIEVRPVNHESLGMAYVEPQLGPHDVVDFLITRLPDEGEVVPENAKPVYIPRDNKADSVSRVDLSKTKYLAAGETSPVFTLPVGKYYVIREPGLYSIKAVLKTIGNSAAPDKFATSNEEKFRVLPFKVVDQKIEELQRDWDTYERGVPNFSYHIYQVNTANGYDDVYLVQRIPLRGVAHWEWQRLCSVKPGTQAQLGQLAPKKVAVLAVHHKGDAGLYTVDFSNVGVKVTSKTVEVKAGAEPKLKIEAGAASVE